METIHTVSAYRAPSGKNSDKDKIKLSLDQSVGLDKKRTLTSSNVQDQINNSNTKVSSAIRPHSHPHIFFCISCSDLKDGKALMLQDQLGVFGHLWCTFLNKAEKIEDVDILVNYGLVIMLPLVAVFTWLSRWRFVVASVVWFPSYPNAENILECFAYSWKIQTHPKILYLITLCLQNLLSSQTEYYS